MINIRRHIGKVFSWQKLSIWEIKRDAVSSLYKNENGDSSKKWVANFYYNIIPFVVSLILVVFGVFLTSDVSNYLITGVSIFAGLFFNLLLIIADKLKLRRELLESNDTEAKENYLKRFEIFSSHFISTISYAIILSLWLIILMLFCRVNVFQDQFFDCEPMFYVIKVLTYSFNYLTYLIGFKLVILLFTILSSLYIMIFDDLNLNKGTHTF
ncbi:hypothetical protein CLV81_0369 [Flagellimonas meridianipacifica]|uniref:Uncharacterized protein n=1 Tax=Flagellimonas meridianipacifica TaxID=1080225 RepID=A0A2T0MFN5_9FLAO|nr:hypothetical protein CLV81_0369 [Allomuricauda pacifica]